jgi:hypothetical protein
MTISSMFFGPVDSATRRRPHVERDAVESSHACMHLQARDRFSQARHVKLLRLVRSNLIIQRGIRECDEIGDIEEDVHPT